MGDETRVHIRWLIRQDMPEVLAIENDCGRAAPWVEEKILDRLRKPNCIGMVAEHGDRIVGFMIYDLLPTTIVVTRFAVHSDYRRQGVGRQMIAKLFGKLSAKGRTWIAMMVRETNLETQLFLRAAGFRAELVKRGFCEDTGEDAYLMRYRLRVPEEVAAI